jgi:DNA-3-methyladenine glycosylase II
MHAFDVDLLGPLDLAAAFERFRRWGDDLLDRWDGHTHASTVPSVKGAIAYACTVAGDLARPRLRVTVAEARHEPVVARALYAAFVQPPDQAWEALLTRDPALAVIERGNPGVRLLLQHDGLTALVRAISTQQVNLTWAATTRRRLVQLAGVRHELRSELGPHEVYSLPAERLAAASVAELRALQFTTRKAEYLRAIAGAVVTGGLDLAALAEAPDDEVVARLTAVRGIGRWSAEWYLARTLGRPVVVAGDLGVRKVVGALYMSGAMPSEQQVRDLTAHWGAAASVAQEVAFFALHRPEVLALAVAAADGIATR